MSVLWLPHSTSTSSLSPQASVLMVRNSGCPASGIPIQVPNTAITTLMSLCLTTLSTYLTKDSNDDRHIPTTDFNVLRLDLKLGSQHSSTSGASLVSQLKKSSIANLLDERIATSVTHIDKLRLRVEDTSSKVLATGDLNVGKSTFVNALLRREVMPGVPLRSVRFTTRHKIMAKKRFTFTRGDICRVGRDRCRQRDYSVDD